MAYLLCKKDNKNYKNRLIFKKHTKKKSLYTMSWMKCTMNLIEK